RVRRDVGRHGEREHQRPPEHATPREVARRDQPRRHHADHQREPARPPHQHHRAAPVPRPPPPRPLRPPPPPPRPPRAHRDDQHRDRQDQRDRRRSRRPRAPPPAQTEPVQNANGGDAPANGRAGRHGSTPAHACAFTRSMHPPRTPSRPPPPGRAPV